MIVGKRSKLSAYVHIVGYIIKKFLMYYLSPLGHITFCFNFIRYKSCSNLILFDYYGVGYSCENLDFI